MQEFINKELLNLELWQVFLSTLFTAYIAYKGNQIFSYYLKRKEDLKNLSAVYQEFLGIFNGIVSLYKQFVEPREDYLKSRDIAMQIDRNRIANYRPFLLELRAFLNSKGLVEDKDLNYFLALCRNQNKSLEPYKEEFLRKYNIDKAEFEKIFENSLKEESIISNTSLFIGIEDPVLNILVLDGGSFRVYFDIKSLNFLNEIGYNAYVYAAITNSIIHIEKLNRVLEQLNNLILKNIEIKSVEQKKIFDGLIEDSNKALISQSKWTMAFVNIALDKIYETGKQKFGSNFVFSKLHYDDYNDSKYVGILPKGYQHLLQKPNKISLASRTKRALAIVFL
jgi:hypothetical protein